MPELTRRTIDKYRIEARIGGGGMGDVYRATHLGFDETVAFKALKENLVHDEELVRRFVREAKICRSLKHSCIVRVTDVSLENMRPPYMVMPLLEGEDLGKCLKRGMLTQEETVAIVSQVLEGLAYAHAGNIIHRDIKAGNIFRLYDGSIQVMDFGLAKVIGGTQMTSVGHVMGTFSYMSPEQTRGEELDACSDLYSVGVLLHYMLDGSLPFQITDIHSSYHKHNHEPPPPLPGSIPKNLRDVVSKSLEKKKEKRFRCADEMRQALMAVEPKSISVQNAVTRNPPHAKPATNKHLSITVQNPPLQPRKPLADSSSGGRWILRVVIAAVMISILYLCWKVFLAPWPAKVAPSSNPSSSPPPVNLLPVEKLETKISSKDGAAMVLLPAGTFKLGDDDQPDNMPHKVILSAYWIYKDPVTVGQYETFVEAMRRSGEQIAGHEAFMPLATGANPDWQRKQDPMHHVNYEDASAYCKWAGVRLPTEAEWEHAARGRNGKKYPWGDEWDKGKCCNKENSDSGTCDVDRFPVNEYGLHDMAGNVFQWCSDWYNADYYNHDRANPTGPTSGTYTVLRGGSWGVNDPRNFLASKRDWGDPASRSDGYGFRCAASF